METKFPLGGDSQNSDKVVFKNHKNKYYLTAEPVMGRVVSNRADAKKWETWTYKVLDTNKISLLSYHEKYLSSIPGGSIVANRTEVKEWEAWTVEPFDDGFALRSWNGRYLTILRKELVVTKKHRKKKSKWFPQPITEKASKSNNFKREDELMRYFALPATDLVKDFDSYIPDNHIYITPDFLCLHSPEYNIKMSFKTVLSVSEEVKLFSRELVIRTQDNTKLVRDHQFRIGRVFKYDDLKALIDKYWKTALTGQPQPDPVLSKTQDELASSSSEETTDSSGKERGGLNKSKQELTQYIDTMIEPLAISNGN